MFLIGSKSTILRQILNKRYYNFAFKVPLYYLSASSFFSSSSGFGCTISFLATSVVAHGTRQALKSNGSRWASGNFLISKIPMSSERHFGSNFESGTFKKTLDRLQKTYTRRHFIFYNYYQYYSINFGFAIKTCLWVFEVLCQHFEEFHIRRIALFVSQNNTSVFICQLEQWFVQISEIRAVHFRHLSQQVRVSQAVLRSVEKNFSNQKLIVLVLLIRYNNKNAMDCE